MLECKTADPRTKLDAAKPEHRYQVILQLGLLRESTEWKPNYAVISYTDSSYWHEGIEFAVAFDEKVFANAQDRARTIMTARSAAEIKPEGWIAGGRECAYCPFTRACGRSRTSVPPQSDEQPDPQFVAEIADLARAAKQRETKPTPRTVGCAKHKHELRERMRAKGFRKVIGNGMSITWSPVRGRPLQHASNSRGRC